MTQVTLHLEPEAVREATSQAILGLLTPELREKLLSDAIKAMLTPSTNSWERNKTPLQVAFGSAVEFVAREEARKLVQEDESIRTRLKQVLRDTADKVLSTDPEKLIERMADAFVHSVKADR